jgi:hypothetical protein
MELAALPADEVMTQLLPDPDAWADAAKDSRNLVAHGGKSSRDVRLMYAITEVTIAVVIVKLLLQLNIPTGRMTYSMTTSGRLERAARLAREHWPAVGAEDDDGEDRTRQYARALQAPGP